MPSSDDRLEGGTAWAWVARGFAATVVGLGALVALGLWLWVRPLRDGPVQAVGLWLGCGVLVGTFALIWIPGPHEHHPVERPHPHRHSWIVVGALVGASVVMAGVGLLATREDRRPALRDLVNTAMVDQPVDFVRETTWAYQPRYVGDLGDRDWSVCRSYAVTVGEPGPVVGAVETSLASQGVEIGRKQLEGGTTWTYAEVRVDGETLLVVCVAEVDADER